jgi:hypothetical protein
MSSSSSSASAAAAAAASSSQDTPSVAQTLFSSTSLFREYMQRPSVVKMALRNDPLFEKVGHLVAVMHRRTTQFEGQDAYECASPEELVQQAHALSSDPENSDALDEIDELRRIGVDAVIANARREIKLFITGVRHAYDGDRETLSFVREANIKSLITSATYTDFVLKQLEVYRINAMPFLSRALLVKKCRTLIRNIRSPKVIAALKKARGVQRLPLAPENPSEVSETEAWRHVRAVKMYHAASRALLMQMQVAFFNFDSARVFSELNMHIEGSDEHASLRNFTSTIEALEAIEAERVRLIRVTSRVGKYLADLEKQHSVAKAVHAGQPQGYQDAMWPFIQRKGGVTFEEDLLERFQKLVRQSYAGAGGAVFNNTMLSQLKQWVKSEYQRYIERVDSLSDMRIDVDRVSNSALTRSPTLILEGHHPRLRGINPGRAGTRVYTRLGRTTVEYDGDTITPDSTETDPAGWLADARNDMYWDRQGRQVYMQLPRLAEAQLQHQPVVSLEQATVMALAYIDDLNARAAFDDRALLRGQRILCCVPFVHNDRDRFSNLQRNAIDPDVSLSIESASGTEMQHAVRDMLVYQETRERALSRRVRRARNLLAKKPKVVGNEKTAVEPYGTVPNYISGDLLNRVFRGEPGLIFEWTRTVCMRTDAATLWLSFMGSEDDIVYNSTPSGVFSSLTPLAAYVPYSSNILIPLNPGSNHWAFALLRATNDNTPTRVILFDSFHDDDLLDSLTDLVEPLINVALPTMFGTTHYRGLVTYRHAYPIAVQQNGRSCGLYTAFVGLYVSATGKFPPLRWLADDFMEGVVRGVVEEYARDGDMSVDDLLERLENEATERYGAPGDAPPDNADEQVHPTMEQVLRVELNNKFRVAAGMEPSLSVRKAVQKVASQIDDEALRERFLGAFGLSVDDEIRRGVRDATLEKYGRGIAERVYDLDNVSDDDADMLEQIQEDNEENSDSEYEKDIAEDDEDEDEEDEEAIVAKEEAKKAAALAKTLGKTSRERVLERILKEMGVSGDDDEEEEEDVPALVPDESDSAAPSSNPQLKRKRSSGSSAAPGKDKSKRGPAVQLSAGRIKAVYRLLRRFGPDVDVHAVLRTSPRFSEDDKSALAELRELYKRLGEVREALRDTEGSAVSKEEYTLSTKAIFLREQEFNENMRMLYLIDSLLVPHEQLYEQVDSVLEEVSKALRSDYDAYMNPRKERVRSMTQAVDHRKELLREQKDIKSRCMDTRQRINTKAAGKDNLTARELVVRRVLLELVSKDPDARLDTLTVELLVEHASVLRVWHTRTQARELRKTVQGFLDRARSYVTENGKFDTTQSIRAVDALAREGVATVRQITDFETKARALLRLPSDSYIVQEARGTLRDLLNDLATARAHIQALLASYQTRDSDGDVSMGGNNVEGRLVMAY